MSACGRLTRCPQSLVGPRHRGGISGTKDGHALAPMWFPAYAARKRSLMSQPVVSGPRARHQVTTPHATSSDRQHASEQPDQDADSKKAGKLQAFASIGVVIVFGVLNRILYKMALVPMGNFVFGLAQMQTFGYVAVYFTLLHFRKQKGIVTKEMLAVPKKQFLGIGAIEALSSVTGFISAAKLPGVALPLLQQSIMFWQLSLSTIFLGKRFAKVQLLGAATVVAGVCFAAWPQQGGSGLLQEANPAYAVLFVVSMLFPALSSIFKERIFAKEKERLNGKDLDIFVVNSFGSGAQAAFVFLLLPLITKLRGVPFSQLPAYLSQTVQTISGANPDVQGAPLLPLLYIASNLAFNIAALNLLRTSGNVVQSLVMSSITPLAIGAFTLNWPYMPPAPPLSTNFFIGVAVLIAGLATYNAPQLQQLMNKKNSNPKTA